MFWLAVFCGSLILLRLLVLFILKLRKNSEKRGCYGALTFPRFEIFLVILALPCICEASAALVRGTIYSILFLSSSHFSKFFLWQESKHL